MGGLSTKVLWTLTEGLGRGGALSGTGPRLYRVPLMLVLGLAVRGGGSVMLRGGPLGRPF